MTGTAAASGAPRARGLSWVLLAAALLVTAGAGVWGVMQPRESGDAHAVAPTAQQMRSLEIPGGLLQVERVADVGLTHRMPGMDVDVVPAAKRRINVQVSLLARSASGLRVAPEDFVLRGRSFQAVAPYAHQLPALVLRRGAAVSGVLTFQIPKGAKGLSLGLRGEDASVGLSAPPARPGHGHQAP